MTHRLSSLNTPPPGFEADQDDDRVMSKAAFNTVVVIGFLALAIAAIYFGTSKIESDISERTSGLLAANGLNAVVVNVSGTSVELKGAIGESPSQEAIFDAVADLNGVTSVDGQLWVVTETGLEDLVIEGDPIEIKWDGNSVVVVGEISNQERKEFITATLSEPFGAVDVGALEVNDEIPDESDWIGTILGLVISVQDEVDSGRLLVFPADQVLVVTGEVNDKAVRNSLNQQVDDAAVAMGFDANAAIRVPEDAAPPPTQEEVDALQEDLDELILDQVIEFETQSDVITPVGLALLDQILTKLESAPAIRVEISGHADAQGSEASNMKLSEDRTLAVLAYLVAQGQSPDRFDLLWFGETQPIASNDTEEGRARNRRIEFRALLEEATP